MKKILVICGHPSPTSLNHELTLSYLKGANESGFAVKELFISDLVFNPNLAFGYEKKTELEPDLQKAQEYISWADHLVFVHPVWWGGIPALFKGFLDRILLPGFAFKYKENSVWWDKLLKGKTARIITTLDQPSWYYWLMYGKPSVNQLKKSTLEFCGIKPVKVTYIGIVKNAKQEQINTWITQVKTMGTKGI